MPDTGVTIGRQAIQVPLGKGQAALEGDLTVPDGAQGVVLFAHGSGSSRHSPRNQYVATELNRARLATLLLDLLNAEEESFDAYNRHLRFNIPILADRLSRATGFMALHTATRNLPIGYFGASTGAAAALVAAATPSGIRAIVSRGGRPDLAGNALRRVTTPTLLIVGGDDTPVIPLNEQALERIGTAEKRLEIVPGASHLFEEPGTLEQVARLATDWFTHYLTPPKGEQP